MARWKLTGLFVVVLILIGGGFGSDSWWRQALSLHIAAPVVAVLDIVTLFGVLTWGSHGLSWWRGGRARKTAIVACSAAYAALDVLHYAIGYGTTGALLRWSRSIPMLLAIVLFTDMSHIGFASEAQRSGATEAGSEGAARTT